MRKTTGPKKTCIVCKKKYIPGWNFDTSVVCGLKCNGIKNRTSIIVKCDTCGKKFKRWPQHIKLSKRQFCSRKCFFIKNTKNGSSSWKGGRTIINGYICVYNPSHPVAISSNTEYVREHRLVVEKQLGRYLLPTELVHHKNGNRLDNRIENLEILTRAEHNRLHFSKDKEYSRKRKSDRLVWAATYDNLHHKGG